MTAVTTDNINTSNPFKDYIESSPSSKPFIDPKDLDSSQVSGRIINCVTQLPNQIYKDIKTNQWDVKHLRGNSALYSSNFFLNQHTNWETHVIGWTGELYTNNDIVNPRHIPNGQTLENDPLYLDEAEKLNLTDKLRKANNSENIHPVWLLRRDQDRWRKYAENVLWPIFHCMQNQPSNGVEETQWWHDYVKFNESYASKIKSIYKKGDIIWIHDYYLLLLPQILRMEIPDCHICSFLHIPFPSSEYFRCLSKRKILLDGMLGSNQVGFQSTLFSKHFISCCSRLLGYEFGNDYVDVHSRSCKIISLPIGIDAKKIEMDAFSDEIDEKINKLKSLYNNKKIIIGRDRLDMVRGVVQKLEAFELFLEMYPEWRNKVVLIQVCFKSFYHSSKLDKKVAELISDINGKYGTLDYTPVHYFQMRIEKEEYLALLRMADLCLITSVRDGMNTTALEYVLCQKYSKSPLILSEFSGSTTVISDAIQVNPWDAVGVSNTINNCLLMSDDYKASLEDKLYESVSQNTIQDWCNTFLTKLYKDSIAKVNDLGHPETFTPYLNKPVLLRDYERANHRLFLFDYDGTLTPIVRDPNAAIPSARLRDTLKKLTADPRNEIWIISGRDQQFLEKWIGANYPQIGLSAEHGCFMKQVNKPNWINLAAQFDMKWQEEVEEIFSKYTEKTPGSHIEKKKVALTWHYRKADPELGIFQAELCKKELIETVGRKYEVEVMSGKANLEVRPSFVNKGEIVRRLMLYADPVTMERKREHSEVPGFVLCLGDDTTDEDMFKALNNIGKEFVESGQLDAQSGIYPVTVGPANKKTVAKAYLSDPEQVLDTLGLLIGDISLFETAGTVDLDDRGHVKNSEASQKSEINRKHYMKKVMSS